MQHISLFSHLQFTRLYKVFARIDPNSTQSVEFNYRFPSDTTSGINIGNLVIFKTHFVSVGEIIEIDHRCKYYLTNQITTILEKVKLQSLSSDDCIRTDSVMATDGALDYSRNRRRTDEVIC